MEQTSTNPLDVIASGDGVELRPIRAEHAAVLYALVEKNRARLREWLPWLTDSYGEAQMRQFALDREQDNLNRISRTSTIWADGQICGAIGFHTINHLHRNSSIGYWLAEEFEGRGIMTAACRALVTEGFINYGLHRIEIRCAIGNQRSKGIPRRLGFTEEGVLREAEWLYDHWVDLRVFAMLARDWNPDADQPCP